MPNDQISYEEAQRALHTEEGVRFFSKKNRMLEALMGKIMLQAAKDSDKKRRLRETLLDSITTAATGGEPQERINMLISVYELVCKEESCTDNIKPLIDLYDRFNEAPASEPFDELINKLVNKDK